VARKTWALSTASSNRMCKWFMQFMRPASRLVAGTQIVARTEIGVVAMRSKIGQLVSIPATFFLIGKRQCRLDSCGASSADGHEAANHLMLDELCTEPHGAGERGGALLPTPSRPCSLDLQSEK
jgi:hypothetical protein